MDLSIGNTKDYALLAGAGTVKTTGNGIEVYQCSHLSAGDAWGELGTLTLNTPYLSMASDSTLHVDLASGNRSDRIDVSGSAVVGAVKFDLSHLRNGTYNVLKAGTLSYYGAGGDWKDYVLLGGESLVTNNPRLSATKVTASQAGNNLQLVVNGAPTNTVVTWDSSNGNGNWNINGPNWSGTVDGTATRYFVDGDAVVFQDIKNQNTSGVNTVRVRRTNNDATPLRKTVADMTINGTQDWKFIGNIAADKDLTTLSGRTGKLVVNTTGRVQLQGDNRFEGGVEVHQGYLVLGLAAGETSNYGINQSLGTNWNNVTLGHGGLDGTKGTLLVLEGNTIEFTATSGSNQRFAHTANKGAIELEKNAVFSISGNNAGNRDGGAINIWADTTFDLTTNDGALFRFDLNKAGRGGAILTKSDTTIGNIAFNSNTALQTGGAIRVESGTTTFTGTADFNANSVTETVYGNNGGALYVASDATAKLVAGKSKFGSNSAYAGGAVASVGTLVMTDAELNANSATSYGGGLYVSGGTARIENSTFSENTAVNGAGFAGFDGTLEFNGVDFKNNRARQSGGGGYVEEGGSVTLTNSQFIGNSVRDLGGGALSINGNLTSNATVFMNNSSMKNGGAVYVSGGTATFTGDTFTGNTANGFGGALSVDGGTTTVTGATFTGNSATRGGAVVVEGGKIEIVNSTLKGNTAESEGGAVTIVEKGEITLKATGSETTLLAENMADGTPNSVSLYNGGTLLIDVARNATVEMRDPMSGFVNDANKPISIRKTSTGLWKLAGETVLKNNTNDVGSVQITIVDGTLQLQDGAAIKMDMANGVAGGTFTLNASGRLGVVGRNEIDMGNGRIDFNENSVLSYDLNSLGTGLKLAAGTFNLRTDDTANFIVDLAAWREGTYTLISTGTNHLFTGLTHKSVTVGGYAASARNEAVFRAVDNGSGLQLTTSSGGNLNLTWDRPQDGDWNVGTAENWSEPTGTVKTFQHGDFVTFDKNETRLITLTEGDVQVSGMAVSGGNYTFETDSNGKIISTNVVVGNKVTPTQKLEVTGSNTVATFRTGIDFAGGMDVSNGAALNFDYNTAQSQSRALTGNGIVRKTGAGVLTYTGNGTGFTGELQVQAGSLYVNDTTLGGTTTVTGGATLGGTGTLGTVILDGGALAPGASIGEVGTLNVDDLTLTSGNLVFDFADPGDDLIKITGSLTQSGVIDIVLDTWLTGTHDVMTVTNGTIDKTKFAMPTNSSRTKITAQTVNSDKTLQLNVAISGNLDLTWANGDKTDEWNMSDKNWDIANETFNPNDYILFDGTSDGTIAVAGIAATSGMKVTGGNYTFAGGKITGSKPATNGQTVTGKLEISGDAAVTLNNETDFSSGYEMSDTSSLTIENNLALGTYGSSDRGQLTVLSGTPTIKTVADRTLSNRFKINSGTLTFDVGADSTTTLAGSETLASNAVATLKKTGTGTLTIDGNNTSFLGTFEQQTGDVHLRNNLAGTYIQSADTKFSAANEAVLGAATFSGTVQPGGTLHVGALTFAGAKLEFDIDPDNASANDLIKAGSLTLTGTNILNTTFTDVKLGTYDLVELTEPGTIASAGNWDVSLGVLTLDEYNLAARGTGVTVDGTGKKLQLRVALDSIDLTWTGTKGNLWTANASTASSGNWTNNDLVNAETKFRNGDTVTFNSPIAPATIDVATNVTVGDMTVNGVTYTFTGTGGIGSQSLSTKLTVENGADLTLANAGANRFDGGVDIESGSTLRLGNGATTGNLTGTISNEGLLSLNRSDAYDLNNAISGSGTVNMVGTGTVTIGGFSQSNKFVQNSGTVELAGTWNGTFTQNAGSLTGNGKIEGNTKFDGTVRPGSDMEIGTITIDGDADFTGAKLAFKIGQDSSSLSDKITVSGTASLADNAGTVIDIHDFRDGSYTFITARDFGGKTIGNDTFTTLVGGSGPGARQAIDYAASTNEVTVTLTTDANFDLTWNGNDGNWRGVDAWLHGSDDETFADHDGVTFNGSGTDTVALGTGTVYVAEMDVTAGTYTFTGAAGITGTTSETKLVGATGKLTVSRNATAIFENTGQNEFEAGTKIDADGTIQLNGSASLGGDIDNDGDFVLNAGAGYVQTIDNAISGIGVTKMIGDGTVILDGSSQLNRFEQSNGTVQVDGIWTGNFAQSAGTLTGSGTIDGMATLSGTVRPTDTLTLQNAAFNGATLRYELGTNDDAGLITLTDTANFTGTNKIDLITWNNGEYVLLTSQTLVGFDSGIDPDVTVNGNARNQRQHADLTQVGEQIVLTTSQSNAVLTWTGQVGDRWNINGTENWAGADTKFIDGDLVVFGDTVYGRDVDVAETVVVGTMTINGANDYTFSGSSITADRDSTLNVAGATGKLVKNGTGTATFNNVNDFKVGTDLNAGTIVLNNRLGLGTQGVRTAENSTLDLRFGDGATSPVEFENNVEGDGAVKTNGNILLSGNYASFAGTATAETGRMSGDVSFGGDLVVNSGATLSPGTEVGEISAARTVTFCAGSNFEVEVDGDESDRVTANRAVIEDGAELNVLELGTAESDSYLILDTTSGISGTFTVGSTFLFDYEQRYDATQLWLYRSGTGRRFADVFDGLGMFNAQQAADGVDRINDAGNLALLGNLGTALGGLTTDAEIIAAFPQLHGEVFASSREAAAQTQRRFLRQLPTARGRVTKTSCGPCSAANSFNEWNRWATFTGDYLNRNNIGNFSAYDLRTYGVAFGMDKNVTKKLFVGAAFGYDDATLKFDTIRSRDEMDVFRSMLYGGWRSGRTYVDGYVGYTKNWHKTRRDITIGNFTGTARSKFDDDMLSTGLEIGRKLRFGRLNVTPSVGLHYIYLDSPNATETGTNGANLHVSGGKYGSLRLPVGARISRDFRFNTSRDLWSRITWTPEFRAFYVAELADDSARVRTSFNNVRNIGFTASSGHWGRSSGVFGVGLRGQLSNRLSLRVDYDHEVYEYTDMGEFSVSAGVHW